MLPRSRVEPLQVGAAEPLREVICSRGSWQDESMLRRPTSTLFALLVVLVAASSCDKGGDGGAPGDGGKPVKRACKMQGKCYLCPDDDAMKKCIINPGTSGCKPASESDCDVGK